MMDGMPPCSDGPGSECITVEFYGIPRQRAGKSGLVVQAGTVGEVLAAVQQHCPQLTGIVGSDGRLAAHLALSINGQRFVRDLSQPLQPGDSVLLLSADMGG
jgi:molybdopterin converting factor small subunit